jgi:hypothetical protein
VGFQVLTSQGDFLCYRGESPGSGDDPAAPLLHACRVLEHGVSVDFDTANRSVHP